jgi:hypothetical protein
MRAENAEGIGIARGKKGSDARAEVVHGHGFRRRRGQVRHGAILAEAARSANWTCSKCCAGFWEMAGSGLAGRRGAG